MDRGSFAPSASDRDRFVQELEFVSLLANAEYLRYLAQSGKLDDPVFVKYLDYLQYWKRPEYAQQIEFPQALYFLDMLQKKPFREALRQGAVVEFINRCQMNMWIHGGKLRKGLGPEAGAGAPGGAGPTGTGG